MWLFKTMRYHRFIMVKLSIFSLFDGSTTLRHARICELLLFHFDVFRLSYYNFRTTVEFVKCGLLMYVWLQFTLKEIWTRLCNIVFWYNIDFVIYIFSKYICMVVGFFFFFLKKKEKYLILRIGRPFNNLIYLGL